MLSSALALADRGMAVFPVRVRDKRPATGNGFKDATHDHDQIKAWWAQDENFNIGIATGAPSGIFVVDVDDDGGELELCKLGVMPDTVESITARGRHIYFRLPKFPIANSASKIAEHVDVRGTGGYVLAPPSVHPSGKRYCWSVDSGGSFADAPQWLLDKLAPARDRNSINKPATDWGALFQSTIGEGSRDDTLTRITGYLLRHCLDPFCVRELVQLWNQAHCNPPLPEADIERICLSVLRIDTRNRGRRHG